MTQVGMIDGEFIINPTQEQWKKGDLNLTVASTREKVIMIEAGANEIPEAKMIEAIYKAHEVNQTIIKFIDEIVAEVGKEKHAYTSCAVPEELFAAIKEIVPQEEMEKAVLPMTSRLVRRISALSLRSWKRLLQRMRSGLLFLVKLYISMRRRLSAR